MSFSTDGSATELGAAVFRKMSRPRDYGKRSFDFVVAMVCFLFTLPVFLIVALAVKLGDGGRIFYSHKRVGQGGREFGCLKFRTMAANGDEVLAAHLAADPAARIEWETSRKLRNDPRVTRVGHILRKLSLDEIPQLLNILKGEMSFVGPRPIVESEVQMYGVRSHLYFRVRPGLTGLWQISGRSDLSYESRVELDCRYVENYSFGSDLMIMLRTVPVVCMAQGSC